jgi:hypothetical protein
LLWYNQTRLHSTPAYVSPVRFEQDCFDQHGDKDVNGSGQEPTHPQPTLSTSAPPLAQYSVGTVAQIWIGTDKDDKK